MQKVDQVYCSLSANWDGGIKCKNSQDLVLSISTQLMHSDELSNYKANIMGYGCGTNSIYNGSTARGWVQWVFMSENALHREDKFLLFVSAPFLIMRLFFHTDSWIGILTMHAYPWLLPIFLQFTKANSVWEGLSRILKKS